ncbi:MAG: HAD family hydrolase [Candidatus Thermoplasmatota archaeon]|jgi:HAD superfamily hydrolase (TIGR01509 family)|nr:HAD family hydrolase [Candidatus Thermoplasmatota archaeon]
MKIKPKAILFDMDGVLIDSLDSWWTSLNAALKAFNYKEISRDEFIEKYWGHDLYDNLKRMGLSEEIGSFCDTVYGEHIDAIKIYPYTKKVLDTLKIYKKGIITNTPKDCSKQIVKRFDIEKYFDVIITSDEVPKAKPYPDIVFRACQLLKVKPEKVVLVGDTDSDVKAGKAAGCIVIGVNIDADYKIKNISELNKIIET